MRRLTPSYVVTSVAIALASTAALAQLRIQAAPGASATTSTPASSTAPQASTTTSGLGVTAGGCTGTGGSTCTTTTSADSSGSTSGNTVPSETTPATAGGAVTTSGTGSQATPLAASSGATASQPFTPDAGSRNLGTVNPSSTNLGNTALVPGVTVGATTGSAGTAGGVNANGERVGIVVADDATPPTPLFELAARQGAEREARRRDRGEEPRIYGIAPRTDRDLTHQMPDDPVIRY